MIALPAPLRLAALAHGRDNNFQLLRLLAAAAVVLFHCYALTNHWTDEPLWKLAPELNLGSLGVKCFFVISGFLVTQSWLARQRIVAFTAARVLRIYPALVCATLLSIALAAWSSAVPTAAFLTDPVTLDYAWRNALGWTFRDRLPGAFVANPFPHAVNGSLWTLPIELRLYLVLGVAGAVGLVARRWLWAIALAAAIAAVVAQPGLVSFVATDKVTRELALLFALGSLAYVWRAAVPVSLIGLALVVALIVTNPYALARDALFQPLVAYAVLVLAYHPRLQLPLFYRIGDYSYGMYVYAFPIQQAIVWLSPGIGPLALFAIAAPLTLLVAVASWHVVERPALGLKSRFSRPPPARTE
jgi:peptidoglycan/LPS O-acetylase OafA/YrhL